MQRLTLGLQFGAQPARTNRHIGSGFESGEQLGSFFDRRRKIGVTEQQYLALGIQHAIADTIALASIPGILNQSHDRVFGREGSNDLCRLISRTIVYDYDFCVPGLSKNVAQDFLEAGAEARALIVGRDHDAVFRRQKSSQFLTLSVSDYGEALKTSPDQGFAIVFASCFSGNKVKRRIDS